MTEFFRFRGMEYLLGVKYQELEKQTIYFASPDELNDPIEGFRDIVWKGDKVVWTNFIKHYIFSLLVSYFLYSITKESEEFDVDKIPIPDQWDLPPNPHLQRLFDDIWHRFLNLPKMSEIFETLANTNREIRYTEFELLLNTIQSIFIVQNRELYFQHGIISESEMQQHMEKLPTAQKLSELILTSLIELEETGTDEQNRGMFQIIEARRNNDRIIHLLNYPDFSVQLEKNALLMILDFPKKYLNEVEGLLWPKWYTACFMKSYHNSSVWGHYGDKHRGACLIFESEKTGSSNSLELHQGTDDSGRKIQFHEISYRDKPSEVEFFRSIGKLPVKALMRLWYTDEDNNISEYAPPSDGIDTWRKNYWDNFYRSITIKSKDWKYEQEHRLILKDSLNKLEEKFKEKKNRTLTYNFHSLKSIIFGIKTFDEDKLRIIDIIHRKCKENNRTDFKFFQAYYSPQKGDIRKFEIQLPFSDAIELNPNDAEAYNNRGMAYGEQGDYDHAIADYTKAIELNPNDADAYSNRGGAYVKKDEVDRAIDDCTKAIELNPNYVDAYNNRGVAYGEQGDYDHAIADYTKAIELNPNDADAYSNRGGAYVKKDEVDRAIDDCTKAIELNPDYTEAYNNRGAAYSNKGDYDRAIEGYTKAIELNPNYVEAYSNRGAAYVKKDEVDRAIDDCTKAIELNPDYTEAYNNRGAAYSNKGDYDRAIEDYIKAMQLNPDYVDAYYNRGNIYGEQGDYDHAIEDYTKAIQLNPDYAEAYKNRGLAYSGKGDYNHAIENYNRAIELKPDFTESYAGRGVARLHLREWEQARADLKNAKDMGLDIIAGFRYFYESVGDFEGRNEVKLPEDLAAMLTPQQ